MSLRQIAISNGISPVTFYARIRRGWDKLDACTTPVRPYYRDDFGGAA